jgi:hypothetical protein
MAIFIFGGALHGALMASRSSDLYLLDLLCKGK